MSVFRYELTDEDVNSLVQVGRLVEFIEKVLLADTIVPLRTHLTYNEAWFGVMPAAGLGFISTKLVGVYPRNPERGEPLVRGVLALFDADSGAPLLLADAAAATAWRTAAATMLALRIMEAPGGSVMGVIGAGVQAKYHILAAQRLLEPSQVLIYSRTKSRAEQRAMSVGGEVVDLEQLLKESEIIIAATNSTRPVVKGSLLREGAVVASVGAPKPVRELDEVVKERAGCLLADTREGVLAESDDAAGFDEIVELREALKGVKCKWKDIRVYKSVGTAFFDHAIALYLWNRINGGSK